MNPLSKIIRTRPRLVFAIIAGLVVALLLPGQWHSVTRILVGWNITVWLYLCTMGWLMVTANHQRVRQIAEQEDKSSVVILSIMCVAAVVSIAAIVLELSTLKGLPFRDSLAHYAFTVATVIGSWFLVAMLFTFHYAHIFYHSPQEHRALSFPDKKEELDYWDFLYFSFTIAVAAQTSDVSVMSNSLRKTALAQSLLSFWFNVAVIGLSINIAAGLLGS